MYLSAALKTRLLVCDQIFRRVADIPLTGQSAPVSSLLLAARTASILPGLRVPTATTTIAPAGWGRALEASWTLRSPCGLPVSGTSTATRMEPLRYTELQFKLAKPAA